jgi:hypothetical protein
LLTWGQWDERGNIRDSELLGDKWKKDGVPMASLVLEGGSYSFFKEQNEEYLFRQFAFFKDKKTGDVGAKISLVADRNSASHSGWLGFTGNVDTGLSRCDAEVRSPREIEIVEMGVKEIKIDLALAQCELVEPITIHLNGGLAQELRNDGHGYGIISIRQK